MKIWPEEKEEDPIKLLKKKLDLRQTIAHVQDLIHQSPGSNLPPSREADRFRKTHSNGE